MYLSGTMISEQILQASLDQYTWPAPYELENEMPDGINLAFPNSNFFFFEGVNGGVVVEFLPENTGNSEITLTIQDALEALAPEVDTRGYDFFSISGPPSAETLQKGLDKCIHLIHTHLLPVVEGDFGWVESVVQKRIGK